jgi:large subunit ribosomal protein L19
MSDIIRQIENENLRDDLPEIRVGDTVVVSVKIQEGDKERIQPFEGLVIKKKGSGIRKTFTVRRITGTTGVERIFVYNSPMIESIDVKKHAKVRKSKLYYMRKRFGKKARLRERREE